MKKIISYFSALILFVSSFGIIITDGNGFNAPRELQITQKYLFSINFTDSYELLIERNNSQTIRMNGFNNTIEPGKPLLPSKKYLIALPPGAKVKSAEIVGLGINEIPGQYNIKPASAMMPLVDTSFSTDFYGVIHEEWKNNFESTYTSDNPFPYKPGTLVCKGTLYDYVYVMVVIFPFKYYPLSGRLYKYDAAEIKITYYIQKFDAISNNPQITQKASELFDNFNEIKALYQPQEKSSSSESETIDYVIITTTDLYQSIISSNFLYWKSYLGYSLKIVNITDELIIGQSGHDLAEQIRTFLREYYQEWGIKYVLMVGNFDTIPMRYCYPDRRNHEFNLSDVFGGEYPTDSYYADLSYPDEESWDSDGDGFYGEYRDDNPDFLPEVYVGRIPTNNGSEVTYTLEKTIAYEMDTGKWKNNVLHAGAVLLFSPFDDGAKGIDYIEKELMNSMMISHYSEQEGVKTSEYSWDPLTEETFTGDWGTGQYGIVNWFGHGWANKVARWVWKKDIDRDNRADDDELVWKDFINVNSDLDDDYPSIVCCESCVVGYPEPCPTDWPDGMRGNLGVNLLTKPSFGAAVAMMSSTRVTYLISQWVTGNICFEFNKRLIMNHESVGEAFFYAKLYYCQDCPNDKRDFCNKQGFNLYGDPSLVYEGITVKGKPQKPIVSGSEKGRIGEEYSYSAISVDPDNDSLYFFFDWGDGSDSSWLGPYESGTECSVSYVWSDRGKYEIKVRVKDTNGMMSEWSDPLIVTMPKNKIIHINPLIMQFLENHPHLFPLLRQLLLFLG